jgi:type IV pilus assembly protein PilF
MQVSKGAARGVWQGVVGGLVLAFGLQGCASSLSGGKREGRGGLGRPMSRLDRARQYVEVANGALLEGDATAALQAIARAEAEDRSLPELYHTKALAFYVKKDLSTAIASGRKAVEMKPNYSDAKNTLGKLLLEAGQYEAAVQPLSEAAQDPLYSDSFKAWTNLGILKYRKNDLTVSSRYLEHAVQDDPDRACIAHYYLGHIRLKEGRVKDAIQEYTHSTKRLCASFKDGLLALGLAYQRGKQYQAARKTFLEIQKRYPNTQVAEKAMDHLKYLP